jgi:hypothetical protein
MKRFKLFFVAAIMTGLLVTSGCVKNEESEGVKELRMAQATLLQARAQATVLQAEAQAAYYKAMASVEEAYALMQVAMARAKEIENEFSETELAMFKAEQQYLIAIAVAKAKADLNAAEMELLASIRELEKAVAVNDNLLLEEYLSLYKAAMNKVLGLRNDIIDETAKLARYQIYVDGDGGPLVAEKQFQKERLQNRILIAESYKESLEEVIGDPELKNEELNAVLAEIARLQIEIGNLEVEETKLIQARDIANSARIKAENEYDAIRSIIMDHTEDIEDFTDGGGGLIDDDMFDPYVSGSYYSIDYYESAIAGAGDDDDISVWEEDMAFVVLYVAYLQAQLDEAEAAYDDASQARYDAYYAWVAAIDAVNDLDAQMSDLQYELNHAQWYAMALGWNYMDQINALENISAMIAWMKADLAEIDITFASWENAVAAQEAKIEYLQVELAHWEAVAEGYKVKFAVESGE